MALVQQGFELSGGPAIAIFVRSLPRRRRWLSVVAYRNETNSPAAEKSSPPPRRESA